MRRPNPASRVPLAAVVLLALAVGCAEDAGDGSPADALAPVIGEVVPANRWAEDHPSLALQSDADVWVGAVQWDGLRDTVVLGELTSWADRERRVLVHESTMQVYGLALAADADDALHVVWSEQVGDGWALRGAVVPEGAAPGELGDPGPVETLAPPDDGNVTAPRLVADGDGQLLLAWVAVGRGGHVLRARGHVPGSGWGPTVDLTTPAEGNAWAPALDAAGPGRFAVVWDALAEGDYDVFLARVSLADDGTLAVADRTRVTDSPRYEARPSVATAGDRVYVAYEVGSEEWGREGSVNDFDRALHITRRVEVVAVEDGTVARLAVPFMKGVSKSLRDGCEMPRIQVDGAGNLVLFFRGLTLPDQLHDPDNRGFQVRATRKMGGGVGWRTSIWFTFMSRFDGAAWDIDGVHQRALPGSAGRSDAPIALGRLRQGGTAYAVVGDDRTREGAEVQDRKPPWWGPMTTEATLVTAGRVRKGPPAEALALGEARPLPAWPVPAPAPPPPATRRLPDGRTVRAALGDLHRHTDLSRCSGNWDGPFSEALRYAVDVAGLEFLAVTDHFEHMTRYDWWRSLALMDLYDSPGRFVDFRAYERADLKTGHRNVISGAEIPPIVSYERNWSAGRDDATAESPDMLWQHFAGKEILTIPHTPAGMYQLSGTVFDWLGFNPEYDRVVEIFQSYRGASEEFEGPKAIESSWPQWFARDALDGGLHFGFIASSDHQSTYGAFAGVWTTGLTRGEVFEALHERRAFAASAHMSLWMDWDGLPMGTLSREDGTSAGRLVVEASAPAHEFSLVELVVDGEVVEARPVSGASISEVFEGAGLAVPDEGSRYAYVRVRTTDEELGWTSPVRRGPDVLLPDGPPGADAYSGETRRRIENRIPTLDQEGLLEDWEGR